MEAVKRSLKDRQKLITPKPLGKRDPHSYGKKVAEAISAILTAPVKDKKGIDELCCVLNGRSVPNIGESMRLLTAREAQTFCRYQPLGFMNWRDERYTIDHVGPAPSKI